MIQTLDNSPMPVLNRRRVRNCGHGYRVPVIPNSSASRRIEARLGKADFLLTRSANSLSSGASPDVLRNNLSAGNQKGAERKLHIKIERMVSKHLDTNAVRAIAPMF
jgi:hypothetical protein